MTSSLDISVQDFKIIKHMTSDWVLIDVREPWELDKASIVGARNIPLGQLKKEIDNLDPNLSYYTLCHYGVRSLTAASLLRCQGLKAHSICGGIDAWSREIDPSVGCY